MNTNRLLLTIEIALLLAVLTLAVLWARNPQGNYEPYITIISGALMIILDIIRRLVKGKEAQTNQPTPKQDRRKSPKKAQTGQEAKYNVTIGDNARQVAIGENIEQSDTPSRSRK